MKIPISQLLLNADLAAQYRKYKRHNRSPAAYLKRLPIVLHGKDGFLVLFGRAKIEAAKLAGTISIDCIVRHEAGPEVRSALALAEMYYSRGTPATTIARGFIDYRDTYHVTQQELGRRMGLTPGVLHHYESLIRRLDPSLGNKVDSGELTFKEARSISDIKNFARQREIAQPFIDGRLSSVHVERIVKQAKEDERLSVDEIIDWVVKEQPLPQRTPEPTAAIQRPAPVEADTQLLENAVLKIAGELDAMRLQVIPEYRRLRLASSLRILDGRVKSALVELTVGQRDKLFPLEKREASS